MNDLAASTLRLLHNELIARRVKTVLDFARDLPPVSGDPIQLQQVLLNLAMNAMDAMNDVAHPERKVTIRTQTTAEGGRASQRLRPRCRPRRRRPRAGVRSVLTRPRSAGSGSDCRSARRSSSCTVESCVSPTIRRRRHGDIPAAGPRHGCDGELKGKCDGCYRVSRRRRSRRAEGAVPDRTDGRIRNPLLFVAAGVL